jgi:L-asparaginase II
VMVAAVLARLLASEADRAALERFVRPTIRNWNGQTVGRVNPVAPLVA